MSRPKPQWQLQALAAQRRDQEIRRSEELKKVSNYFEAHTNTSKLYELWTTASYYEKANKEAELLSEKKIKAVKLEERRKKLELMLFQEHVQYQQELKTLAAQPKLYKNGSYLNNIPTSTLREINQGIMAKEESLRRHEAELKLHHAWRMRQPELRAAQSFVNNGKLKSAWTEQIVAKELQKQNEELETRKILKERDESLRRQIQIEEETLKEKEMQMKELRTSLEGQIAELSEKERIVKQLRKQEEKEQHILDEIQHIGRERERELKRLAGERDAVIVNMGLHKYKLKRKAVSVLKEIELDLEMLERIKKAVLKDYESERESSLNRKRVVEQALRELEQYREKERARQKNIDAMYDGEARQINEKQDRIWASERSARAALMSEVVSALSRQVEERIEANRARQKMNVLERERILTDMDTFHQDLKSRERETKLQASSYSNINTLQSELNGLKLKQQQLEDTLSREAELKASIDHERFLHKEIAKIHREGTKQAWS